MSHFGWSASTLKLRFWFFHLVHMTSLLERRFWFFTIWFASTCFWAFYFLVDFSFCFFLHLCFGLGQHISFFYKFWWFIKERQLGAALIHLLGSSFLTSCLVVTSITFSFSFGSLGSNFRVSFQFPFSLATLWRMTCLLAVSHPFLLAKGVREISLFHYLVLPPNLLFSYLASVGPLF